MRRYIWILFAAFLLGACTVPELGDDGSASELAGEIINVGSPELVTADAVSGLPFTKATPTSVPAETQDWLRPALFEGLEVRYWKDNQKETTLEVARLELQKDDSNHIKYDENGLAEYILWSLNEDYTKKTTPARWKGNGTHIFQGVYVPDEIRKDSYESPALTPPADLTTDQSRGNYTSLEQYLAMPAGTKIAATVGRISLPYRHRLSRVLAYVLIDPKMGNVKLEGFGSTDPELPVEDPRTTKFTFSNVKVLNDVLKQVEIVSGKRNERLIPEWTTARKVVPHFAGMRGSRNSMAEDIQGYEDHFVLFLGGDGEKKEPIFPVSDQKWQTARSAWDAKYNPKYRALISEGKTPEEAKALATEYANETSGYERVDYGLVPCYDVIVRPTYTAADEVMYDEAQGVGPGESNKIDFELTLDNGLSYFKEFKFDLNANHQTVVFLRINHEKVDYDSAGSEMWMEEERTDGYYGVNNRNENALSRTGSSWQRAYRIGENEHNYPITDGHYYDRPDGTNPNDSLAQYVTDAKWLELFKEAYEGGRHHGDYFILDRDITIDVESLPEGFVFTGHLDVQNHVITVTNAGKQIVDEPEKWIETRDYTLQELYVKTGETYTLFALPSPLYKLYDGNYEQVDNPTVYSVMTDSDTYYVKNEDGSYAAYEKPAKLYRHDPAVVHYLTAGLFAGLNGAYEATEGKANVHRQRDGVLVPYVDSGSGTGWRAEILNAKIKGADLFPADVLDAEGRYIVGKVSGYVNNCWVWNVDRYVKVKDHVPALPRY